MRANSFGRSPSAGNANKDALLLAALEHAWGTIKQRMYTRLSQDEHDALGFFAELLPITSENRIAVVVWFHYWLRGLNSPPLAERRRANRIGWLQMLEKCLLGNFCLDVCIRFKLHV